MEAATEAQALGVLAAAAAVTSTDRRDLKNAKAMASGRSSSSAVRLRDEDGDGKVKINDSSELLEEDGSESSGGGHDAGTATSVIVLATVDGSLAGLCRETGQLLWMRSPPPPLTASKEDDEDPQADGKSQSGSHTDSWASDGVATPGEMRRVLQPLVATTTTKQSTRRKKGASSTASSTASSLGSSTARGEGWNTAAVPSIDGSVYLTAAVATIASSQQQQQQQYHQHQGHPHEPQEVTVATSIPELVARSPFVDTRGRIYTGSRQSVSFALDGDTGEILQVIPTEAASSASFNSSPAAPSSSSSSSSCENRPHNVVWLGRVDYGVSIHEARTGELDVQFASSQIMGVNDMLLTAGKPSSSSLSTTTRPIPSSPFHRRHHRPPASTSLHPLATSASSLASVIVATPNGRVALRDELGQISWVSDATFRSPVAFAVDSTGSSMAVDMLADAAIPNGSAEYVSKEMERQMMNRAQQQGFASSDRGPGADSSHDPSVGDLEEDEDEDEQTIIGFLSTGDLFAMPLRRRRGPGMHSSVSSTGSSASSSVLHHTTASSYSAAASASTSTLHAVKVPGLARPSILHSHSSSDSSKINHHHKKASSCRPGSPLFPHCLVLDGGSHQVPSHYLSESWSEDPSSDPNLAALVVKYPHEHQGDWYVPPHYYTIVKPPDKRQRRYQKLLRILGSWLPPTIALLFVVSFELGRRKRQERHGSLLSQSSRVAGASLESSNVEGTTTVAINPHNDAAVSSGPVGAIQVIDDVILGYGGHGTVVYKGLLEGRQVAVKRMLRTYHASADREISLLIESDGHPNVVRYFLKEVRGDFVYLALELCDMSLHDLILKLKSRWDHREKENQSPMPPVASATRSVLFQIARGVRHLHSLRIVHRFVDQLRRHFLSIQCRNTND
jgi:serine/threonine protein kinase